MKPPRFHALPAPFLAGLILAGGFMVFAAWDQSYWWRVKEDYAFGWLVPLFVAYLVYDRWPKVVAQTRPAVGSAGGPAGASTWSVALANTVAFLALLGGGVLFVAGAFYKAAAGTTHLSTLAITSGMTCTVLAAIFFMAPAEAGSLGSGGMSRWRMAMLFLFPSALWLLSAPMVSEIEHSLNLVLMRAVTSVVFFVFDQLGLPLEQRGNVLVLPNGSVGVEEACSGIRSLTGCLFAGSFLAAVFLRSRWRQTALVAASLVFAFLANLLRGLFLTSWAYRYGAGAIEGAVHDLSGYAVLGMTVLALLSLLPVLDRKQRSEGPPTPVVQS